MVRVLLLTGKEIEPLFSMPEVMEAVESAFKEKGLGFVQMPPKIYLSYTNYNGDLRAMPSYLERLGMSAVKVVNAHPDNQAKFGLPTVMATIILVDPRNGAPLAIMNGTHITAMRTGAGWRFSSHISGASRLEGCWACRCWNSSSDAAGSFAGCL